MALSNLCGWEKREEIKVIAACGVSDKLEEKPAACGTACGASDKPEETPAACGTAWEHQTSRRRNQRHVGHLISKIS